MKLKFGMMPGHWGLKGKTREIAKAEYELEGFELEERLLEIKQDEMSAKEYIAKVADLKFKWNKIDKFTHLRILAELIENDESRALALLELDLKEGKINETQYAKQHATLKNEPWVTVLQLGFGGDKSLEGNFELDWNDQFVDHLKASGYNGSTPDLIVNEWFMTVCKNIALEEFDGTGDFAADAEANMEAVRRWGSTESYTDNRKGYK